jgi:cytochrome c oxidase subunit IV
MEDHKTHITGYLTYGIILVFLLVMTLLSVTATNYHLGAFTVALALTIASIKVAVVLFYFMHLKSESLFLKLAVGGVFLLFILVIVTTFIDYFFR